MSQTRTIRPDAKGRVALGSLASGVSSFRVSKDMEGRIILEPFAEIPANEKWLFENKEALAAVKKGLVEAANSKTSTRGSFVRFANDKLD